MRITMLKFLLLAALATTGYAQISLPRSPLRTESVETTSLHLRPRAVVAPLDRILPDILDGGGASTSITIVNLDSQPADFQLFFVDVSGNLVAIPVRQLSDPANTIQGTVPVGGSVTIDTAGQASTATDAWALLGSPSGRAIGATVIEHYHVEGVPDTDATLSLASLVETSFRLAFDNRNGASAGLMLIHSDVPSAPTAKITLVFRDGDGNVLKQFSGSLPPLQKAISVFTSDFPETAGVVGTVDVSSTGRQLAALGLRLNSAGNLSFYNVLSAQTASAGPSQPAPATGLTGVSATCSGIIGAAVYANDGQFLGRISNDQFAADSMANSYGQYGSPYAQISIFNQFGPYGGQFSILSPFNQFTTTPPVMFVGSKPAAYLTLNKSLTPRIDTTTMTGCIGR
jgi:hypothetical protein